MTIEPHIFAFESDFAASLRCIPMAVRFKLDLAGVKLSLRQWSRFGREERHVLLLMSCESPQEIRAYRAKLVVLIDSRCDEPLKPLGEQDEPAWDAIQQTPNVLLSYAAAQGVMGPSRDQWRGLTRLQRFVLIKLTRERHENANFIPALLEMGLLEQVSA